MPESRPFDAICSQHGVHPEQCWEKHVVTPPTRALGREDLNAAIAQTHLAKQKENSERKASEQTTPAQAERGAGQEASAGVSEGKEKV
jgi:hypothetical protein